MTKQCILTNHLGYGLYDAKRAVYQGEPSDGVTSFTVLNGQGEAVFTGSAQPCGTVARWNTGSYWVLDFTPLETADTYTIRLTTVDETQIESFPFCIGDALLPYRLMNAVGYYFKGQRDSGAWRAADSCLPFAGDKPGTIDAHGGWLDATGDYGIHMSHLSHSTWFNPQQVPLSAWVFLQAYEQMTASGDVQYSMLKERMLDEGTYGADFIMRMRAPDGNFYRSINRLDSLADPVSSRNIGFEYHGSSNQFGSAATADQEKVDGTNYETSLRSGGGVCIAALAAAARHPYPGTDYAPEQYLAAAEAAWDYLKTHNNAYTNNGRENLLDAMCALLATVELYRTTGKESYLADARAAANTVLNYTRSAGEGLLDLTCDGQRPFFHAADEGLPIVALLHYADAELNAEKTARAAAAAEALLRRHLELSAENNPFGYAKMLCCDAAGKEKVQFFFPHDTTAAPWWQGDDARIASLAAAALLGAEHTADAAFAKELRSYAQDQLNWILGLNPFDACMMEGYGRNNIQYSFNGRCDFLNAPGGICNGITAGLHDEEGIDFIRWTTPEISDNWRWAEQWIPHATWFLYAVCVKTCGNKKK